MGSVQNVQKLITNFLKSLMRQILWKIKGIKEIKEIKRIKRIKGIKEIKEIKRIKKIQKNNFFVYDTTHCIAKIACIRSEKKIKIKNDSRVPFFGINACQKQRSSAN